MALTIDVIKRVALPAGKAVVADVTFDATYPAGGESLTAADLGFTSLEALLASESTGTHMVVYDYTNSKLRLFDTPGTEEVTADQSSTVVRVFAVGDNVGVEV